MTRYTIIIAFLWTGIGQLSAQQLSLFNQFYETYMLLNPAQIPTDYVLGEYRYYGGITYRNQWSQLEGAPKTYLARFNWIDMDFNTNTGGYIMQDRIGDMTLTSVYGKYAYMINLNSKHILSAGLSLGFGQFQLDINPSEVNNDPKVSNERQSVTYLDSGLGIYYQYQADNHGDKMFYAGLTIPQLMGLDLFTSYSGAFQSELEPHFYLSTGGAIKAGNGHIELNAWGRYVKNAPFHGMLYGRYLFDNIFWVGGGLALNGTIHGELGFYPNSTFFQNPYFDLKVGLAYERPMDTYGYYFGNTLELNLTFVHL